MAGPAGSECWGQSMVPPFARIDLEDRRREIWKRLRSLAEETLANSQLMTGEDTCRAALPDCGPDAVEDCARGKIWRLAARPWPR